jgi:hypothetical protein
VPYLLVGKDQKDGVSQLILGQHAAQFFLGFSDTFAVITVDHKDKTCAAGHTQNQQLSAPAGQGSRKIMGAGFLLGGVRVRCEHTQWSQQAAISTPSAPAMEYCSMIIQREPAAYLACSGSNGAREDGFYPDLLHPTL